MDPVPLVWEVEGWAALGLFVLGLVIASVGAAKAAKPYGDRVLIIGLALLVIGAGSGIVFMTVTQPPV